MILNAIAEKLKRQSKDVFKGRNFESGGAKVVHGSGGRWRRLNGLFAPT